MLAVVVLTAAATVIMRLLFFSTLLLLSLFRALYVGLAPSVVEFNHRHLGRNFPSKKTPSIEKCDRRVADDGHRARETRDWKDTKTQGWERKKRIVLLCAVLALLAELGCRKKTLSSWLQTKRTPPAQRETHSSSVSWVEKKVLFFPSVTIFGRRRRGYFFAAIESI